MIDLTYTRHAQRRTQQRGVPPEVAEAVLFHADIEMSLGGGRSALRLSTEAVACLARDHAPALAEQAKDVVLIVRGDVLVTVLHAWGQPGRRYRRRRGCHDAP